ncbi:hypothetical protein CEQ29_000030 [Listeria monocytogenes]|nr:hypothetical protein CEQ29_000030 [Listeria monocytogenes]
MIILFWAQDRAGNIGKITKCRGTYQEICSFSKTTTGKHLLWGEKTYESLGKALPNRKTSY